MPRLAERSGSITVNRRVMKSAVNCSSAASQLSISARGGQASKACACTFVLAFVAPVRAAHLAHNDVWRSREGKGIQRLFGLALVCRCERQAPSAPPASRRATAPHRELDMPRDEWLPCTPCIGTSDTKIQADILQREGS